MKLDLVNQIIIPLPYIYMYVDIIAAFYKGASLECEYKFVYSS